MNSIQFKSVICYLVLTLFLSNCTPENDFETPLLVTEEQPITGTIIDIEAILGVLGQEIEKEGENANVIFKDTDNVISGYVISSDRASNFFKELVIQNKNANPTAGIRILIDDNPLFTSYEFGRKIYINLEGLSIGIENGVPTLGVLDGHNITQIPSFLSKDIITRSSEISSITPLETTLENFTDQYLNLYIKLNNIQFNKNIVLEENEFTFAAEPNDKFDGERIIESCKNGRTTILSTSTFSDFKGLKLPKNQGSFEGILTKNFVGDAYNIVLNDPNGLVFDTDTRCDPQVLNCVIEDGASVVLFEQDFTEFKSSDLNKLGWLNANTYNGKLKYKIGEFNKNKYAQITGFRSKESLYEIWLITPEIDLSETTNEVLNFDLQAGYDNGNIIEVFVIDNFVDDISSANRTKLDAVIPRGPLNSFGDFIPAGPIGLSCVDDVVRIGFRYTGGDPRATTRYHIDNITVTGK